MRPVYHRRPEEPCCGQFRVPVLIEFPSSLGPFSPISPPHKKRPFPNACLKGSPLSSYSRRVVLNDDFIIQCVVTRTLWCLSMGVEAKILLLSRCGSHGLHPYNVCQETMGGEPSALISSK